jgi:GT2 family glycosyltransferase
MLSKQTFEQIGPFDEQFSPAFYEDTDYFHRAWKMDIPLKVVPKSIVSHTSRTTTGYLPNLHETFAQNRMKYATKHGLNWTLPPPFYTRSLIK